MSYHWRSRIKAIVCIWVTFPVASTAFAEVACPKTKVVAPPSECTAKSDPMNGSAKPIHLLHGSGLHHINVRAFDLDKTISFYERAFGFRLLFRWDGVEGRRGEAVHFRKPAPGCAARYG